MLCKDSDSIGSFPGTRVASVELARLRDQVSPLCARLPGYPSDSDVADVLSTLSHPFLAIPNVRQDRSPVRHFVALAEMCTSAASRFTAQVSSAHGYQRSTLHALTCARSSFVVAKSFTESLISFIFVCVGHARPRRQFLAGMYFPIIRPTMLLLTSHQVSRYSSVTAPSDIKPGPGIWPLEKGGCAHLGRR